ncbi:MAG TPA: type II toxin-antitoxin system death-on-curing family toxin [bacterium]|nr:type II toxin-antitoxin system death-on-curing family toxin [bacterium]
MLAPDFLTLEDVLQLHADQIKRYGGTHGVRDLGLLHSALAQPEAGFGDKFFHPDLAAMAAAYLFHIVQNHPFLDGNKRTGLASALLFLDLNGFETPTTEDQDVELVLGIAEGRLRKEDAASYFREHMRWLEGT